MKVYLVYWCNNEQWEDYCESVDAVFSTRERAEQFIIAKGYTPHVCDSEWEKKHMADRFDSIDDDGYGLHYSMWVREMEVLE